MAARSPFLMLFAEAFEFLFYNDTFIFYMPVNAVH